MDDGLFWQHQSDGLALYSRPGWWRSFRVPLDLPELAVVGDRFHVSPLLRLLTGDGHFLVLASATTRFGCCREPAIGWKRSTCPVSH